jgi:hypothetical protein
MSERIRPARTVTVVAVALTATENPTNGVLNRPMGSFDKLRMTGEPMGSFGSTAFRSRIREGVGFASRRMTGKKKYRMTKGWCDKMTRGVELLLTCG